MTQNQINYWRLQEEKRANAAVEAETRRANQAKEAENFRSNLARETETHRSNTVNEGIAFGNLTESQRSHMAQEDINRGTLEETIRHQMVTEAETMRSNIARETENYRHNSAVESENVRHNTAVESETRRANIVYEGIEAGRLTEQTVYHQQQMREQQKVDTWKYQTDKLAAENSGTQQIVYVNNPRFRGESGGVSTSDGLLDTWLNYVKRGGQALLP